MVRANTARDVPADELISEALFGLTYAAGRYDEDRHVPFGAYANMVIRHRLIQTVIRWRDKRFAPLPDWSESSGEPWEAADYRPAPDLCAAPRPASCAIASAAHAAALVQGAAFVLQ